MNEGEYKVMGLAAYGAPRFRDELAQVLRIDADGSFRLEPRFFAHTTERDVGFSPALETLLGPRRPPGRRFALAASADDQRCADVAASLQLATEEALLALARAARARTGATALCLAGGVALNARANARLAREAGFDRVFVPPAAGDAGGALGAALIGARDLGDRGPRPSRPRRWASRSTAAPRWIWRARSASRPGPSPIARPPSPPTSPPAGWSRSAAGGSSGGRARSASVRCWRTPPAQGAASG